jgi:hypothetical protein
MKKRPSQNASGGEKARRATPGETTARSGEASTKPVGASGAGPGPNAVRPYASTPQLTNGSARCEKTEMGDAPEVVNNVLRLESDLQTLVDKLLTEGSTFEDVVEAVNARGEGGVTLNAVRTYFQGNRALQTKRALHQVEDCEALLASLGKDPESAEARLARATFMTGYSRVNRNASLVTPREAARYRLESENLNLKHQVLMLQKKKADQDLEYSKAKTALIKATGAKVQREILGLERELRARQAAGHPVGNDVLQKIQQLYGLACQPLLEEVVVSGGAKA